MDKPTKCVQCKYFKSETSDRYDPNTVYLCNHKDMPLRSKVCVDTDVLYSYCPIKTDNDR